MAKERSLLARLVSIARLADDAEPVAYPAGMAQAAREARERLKQRGTLEIELDAQREINGRVSQFGKAA